VNPDIGEEASTFLQASGLLSSYATGACGTPGAMTPTASPKVFLGTDTSTPRLDGFSRSRPPAGQYTPTNADKSTDSDTAEANTEANTSHTLYSQKGGQAHSAASLSRYSGGENLAKHNGFGSFLYSPALPTVSTHHNCGQEPGNPAAAAFHGLSGPLGTPRSEALTIDLQPPGSVSMPRHFRGHPTVSHALEPGPYHKANSRLRVQFPHYTVKVNIKTRWDHILVTVIAFVIFAAYIGLRVYYLATGRAEEFHLQNISILYSWVVLGAEIVLGLLLFYSKQLFWKQELVYTVMDDEELGKLTEVRRLCPVVNTAAGQRLETALCLHAAARRRQQAGVRHQANHR
jgi:hypothetical protein